MISLISIILLSHFILSWLGNAQGAVVTYNVVKFGAKADGISDATQSFLKAWAAACAAPAGAIIYVPKGRYLIKAAEFRGPCKSKIKVQIAGTLVAPADYRALGAADSWILFIKVDRISVVRGFLDARGAGLWACKTSGKSCPTGARSLTFNWVNEGEIKGLTSINSQLMHVVINSCKNVKVSNVKIVAPALSPNTDGIHIQSSTGVTVTNAVIKTGDDCVSIGPDTRNLWMDKIQCGPGHGVSIGSLGRSFDEDGVENVTLTNSVFSGSDNGLRIKTWARPSKGFVRNINYKNILMKNVEHPIIIDQNYCPNNQGCPSQGSGIKISQITYQNIQGTSATEVAMEFDCSPTNPCSGIKVNDIKLTYTKSGKAQSLCKNIAGTSGGVIMPVNCL